MKLTDWIEEKGPAKVAQLLGVDKSTVYYWQNLKAAPSVQNMGRIKKLSKGLVSYDDMIEPYLSANKLK